MDLNILGYKYAQMQNHLSFDQVWEYWLLALESFM